MKKPVCPFCAMFGTHFKAEEATKEVPLTVSKTIKVCASHYEHIWQAKGVHTRCTEPQVCADVKTPMTNAKEFIGQAEWAEDNAPLLGCVESDFARKLEQMLAIAEKALEASKGAEIWKSHQECHKALATISELKSKL